MCELSEKLLLLLCFQSKHTAEVVYSGVLEQYSQL